MSIFYDNEALLWHWGLAYPEETTRFRAGLFLERVNNSLESMLFMSKPINPEPISSGCLLYGAVPVWTTMHPPLRITPGPSTRQWGVVSIPQSLLKLFKLGNPWSSFPASLNSSHKNHNKGFCPGAYLCCPTCHRYGMACLLFLETYECKLLLSWQSFPCLPVLTSWWKQVSSTL